MCQGLSPFCGELSRKAKGAPSAICPVPIAQHSPERFYVQCRWDEGHIEEWSAISYPNELHMYVTREFQRIKQRQADLLGIKDGIRSKL